MNATGLYDHLCMGCTSFTYYRVGRGWVHTEGGGRLWQRCKVCSWSGSEASMLADRLRVNSTGCPDCGSFDLFTDHTATPSGDVPSDAYLRQAIGVLEGLVGGN